MSHAMTNLITDVSPWPNGSGFSGAQAWWKHVLSQEEHKRLDNLMGIALLDDRVREQLLNRQDESLFKAFGLSEETRQRVREVKATTLVDLAQALTASVGVK